MDRMWKMTLNKECQAYVKYTLNQGIASSQTTLNCARYLPNRRQ